MKSKGDNLIRSLFQEIYTILWGRRKDEPDTERIVAHIRSIKDKANPVALPWLLALFGHTTPVIGNEIASAIEALAKPLTPLELAEIDGLTRNRSEYSFRQIYPAHVIWLAADYIHTLGILSFHPNGFVREG